MSEVYLWQNAYNAAILQTDDGLMTNGIYEALAAIQQRRLSPIEPDSEEHRGLTAADSGLQSLISERAMRSV
jgi:hypothetical protein